MTKTLVEFIGGPRTWRQDGASTRCDSTFLLRVSAGRPRCLANGRARYHWTQNLASTHSIATTATISPLSDLLIHLCHIAIRASHWDVRLDALE